MTFQISLNSNSSDIYLQYPGGISLEEKPYTVGLKSFVTYNTICNVFPGKNSITFVEVVDGGGYKDPRTIVLKDGAYEIQDIIAAIEEGIPRSKDTDWRIRLIRPTGSVEIVSGRYKIDLSHPHSIASLLGYTHKFLNPVCYIFSTSR